ncbi:c-type cytochrome [Sorangium cellulosum]|uniref:Cytochrome c domain-containing protein n=1 Tax=Sorangium cellulosum So0157-2 TaxID=1254432 RepID=S4XSD1_SORCE|nr:c-type cytochrome [Sorangium cellulosum]AGP33488.1 hypothetical protein SCE1572_02550 [Sorangium cellulosum So0157-2]
MTEGAHGTAHVALRRGGAVVTIDLATKQAHRRPVCPAPRGVAYDAAADLLHVACAGGELVTLSSDLAAPPVRELRLDRDLRDVVVEGEALLVSRFRSPELLVVTKDSTVAERVKPPVYVQNRLGLTFEPAVAWRVAEAVVCASCHPEGQDDGRSWSFNPTGLRRTQSLAGGVLDTAPLHWDGDLKTFRAFLREVFVKRMGESHPSPEGVAAFASWLDAIKPVPLSKPADQGAVRRGEALFNDATVGCASCHSGETLTNDQTVDVGTGKAFQVPSLRGLAARAPYMHDGCAATLRDRFGPCGGGDKHGVTSTLTPAQIDDLVAYLETL